MQGGVIKLHSGFSVDSDMCTELLWQFQMKRAIEPATLLETLVVEHPMQELVFGLKLEPH